MTLIEQLADTTEGLGRILFPGDAGWDEARATFNPLVDQRPAAIAVPTDEREVAAVIGYARDRGWKVAPQATGHNPAPLGDLTDTLILNTSALTGIHIDAEAHRVRVGAAVRWRDVIAQLSDLGLAALHGSSPLVGVTGYSLGGGIGWLSRKYGLQANAVTSVDLVTAEGHLVRTDAVHEPELFWALRGGSGNFGVVTSLEFKVVDLRELYAGHLFFPFEKATEVLNTWASLLPTLPEELTTWVTLAHLPPFPEIPEPLRGRSFAIVMAAFLGNEQDGSALLAPLRALGPELDMMGMQSPVALGELAMDPDAPMPGRSTTSLLSGLPAPSVEALVKTAAPGSPLAMVQFRHLGGAAARVPAGAGARGSLPGEIVMYAAGLVLAPEDVERLNAALGATWAIVSPYEVGKYSNFVEAPADASDFWDAETWTRLRRAKALYDPRDVFKGNHHIPPLD